MKSAKAFIARCEDIDAESDIGVMFFTDAKSPDIFEDDGNLHVRRFGMRAVFDVGKSQTATAKEQNERTAAVLAALSVAGKAKADRVFVDADDEGDDACPSCGRAY
jgi:uncharacterized Zn-finger protein